MIQRKQSLYLLLVAVISVIILFGNLKYATFDNSELKKSTELRYATTDITDGTSNHSVSKWINVIVITAIGSMSLFAIFLYKKHELQKKICIYSTLLEALLILIMALDYNTTSNAYPGNHTYPGLFSVFPVVMIVFSFLAWRGVRKDEELLKSMDRIR